MDENKKYEGVKKLYIDFSLPLCYINNKRNTDLCNGSTYDSDSYREGSNPSSVASLNTHRGLTFFMSILFVFSC